MGINLNSGMKREKDRAKVKSVNNGVQLIYLFILKKI